MHACCCVESGAGRLARSHGGCVLVGAALGDGRDVEDRQQVDVGEPGVRQRRQVAHARRCAVRLNARYVPRCRGRHGRRRRSRSRGRAARRSRCPRAGSRGGLRSAVQPAAAARRRPGRRSGCAWSPRPADSEYGSVTRLCSTCPVAGARPRPRTGSTCPSSPRAGHAPDAGRVVAASSRGASRRRRSACRTARSATDCAVGAQTQGRRHAAGPVAPRLALGRPA